MSAPMQKWENHHAGLVMLRHLTKKLLRVISLSPSRGNVEGTTMVPKDVKEGHFAVIAAKAGKQKRFILDISYLRNPEFLRLLEQAKEEYGFRQMGVLVLPCQPEDLQKILEETTAII